jgi:hypothetical protein
MTYNCEEIVIPLIDEPSVSVTTLYVTKTCCGEPIAYTYCNPDNQTNLLNIFFTLDNIVGIKEEPQDACFSETTWDEFINLDVSQVVSFTGVKKTYDNGILQTTEDIDLSYFNTTRTILTTANNLYKSYKFVLHFQLADIAINYQIGYNTNVYNFYPPCFTILDFDTYVDYQYNCLKELSIGTGGIHFPIDLSDGFYSASWTTYEGCFVVECDETLACKVKKFIESIFNSTCYHCNKEKDLETSMKILMYYKAFLSDCLDCCEKCNAYEKIIDIINGCKDC